MHPLTAKCESVDEYHTLMPIVRQDEANKFFDYYRMTQTLHKHIFDNANKKHQFTKS